MNLFLEECFAFLNTPTIQCKMSQVRSHYVAIRSNFVVHNVVLLGSVQHPNINYFLSTCDACSREVFEFDPRATYIDISTSLHVKMHPTLDEPQHYYLQACTENL